MARIPIAKLEPGQPSTQSIRGIVTLLWPFSSSTKKAAFLLADPDFRMRYKKGQVRVQVHGAVAQALAKSKFGIGDEVELNLEGAHWVDTEPGVTTPGKSLDSELLFRRKISVKILRNGETWAHVVVDSPTSPEHTPAAMSPTNLYFTTPGLPHSDTFNTPGSMYSPAYHKRARMSGGEFVDSPLDPFVGDGSALDWPERKRMRISWGNTPKWKLANRIPSPSKDQSGYEWLQDQNYQSFKELTPAPSPAQREQSQSPKPVAETSVDADFSHRSINSEQLNEMRQRYTQEFIDTIAGDTEADSISDQEEDGENAPASPLRPYRDPDTVSYPNLPLPTSFSTGPNQTLDAPPLVHFSPFTTTTAAQIDVPKIRASPESNTAGARLNMMHGHDPGLHLSIPPQMDFAASGSQGSSYQPVSAAVALTSSMGPPMMPVEPHTPELHPLESANLPLPSPFPGEDLSNPFARAVPPRLQSRSSFEVPQPSTSPLFPDHLFQFSFGADVSADQPGTEPSFPLQEAAGGPEDTLGTDLLQNTINAQGTIPREGMVVQEYETDEPTMEMSQFQHTHAGLDQSSHHHTERDIPPMPSQSSVMLDALPTQSDFQFNPPSLLGAGSVHVEEAIWAPPKPQTTRDESAPTTNEVVDLVSDQESSGEPQAHGDIDENEEMESDETSGNEASDVPSDMHSEDADNGRLHRSDDGSTVSANLRRHPSETGSFHQFAEEEDEVSSRQSSESGSYESDADESEDDSLYKTTPRLPQADDADGVALHGRYTQSQAVVQSEPIVISDSESSDDENDDDEDVGREHGSQGELPLPFGFDGAADPMDEETLGRVPTILDLQALDYETGERLSSPTEFALATASLPINDDQSIIDLSFPWPEHLSKVEMVDPALDKSEHDNGSRPHQDRFEPTSVPTGLVTKSTIPDHPVAVDFGTLPSHDNQSTFQPAQTRPEFLPLSQMTLVTSFESAGLPTEQSQAQRLTGVTTVHVEESLSPILPSFSRQTTATSALDAQDITAQKMEVEELRNVREHKQTQSQTEATEKEIPELIELPQLDGSSELHTSPPTRKGLRSEKSTAAASSSQLDPTLVSYFQPPTTSAKGLRTPLSYYTPLANLATHMNRSSQFDSAVDILAIVYRATSDPMRADKGPKDYFTKLRVTQPGFWPRTTLVTVFRAWKAALPRAVAGDAVLLKCVDVVELRGGGAGVRSTEGSAWCVWKVQVVASAVEGESEKPAWARRETREIVEEVSGPPVEIGAEERNEAKQLRDWWVEIQKEGEDQTA